MYSFPFSQAVRKTWREVRTGEDLPGRTGAFQTRFLAGLNSVGKPDSLEIPEPLGPRKRGQSCAYSASVRNGTNSRSFMRDHPSYNGGGRLPARDALGRADSGG